MSPTSFEEESQTRIDAVINQLAGTNSSLAACSLVSKRWHPRCRQQIFRKARLADLDDDLRSSGWSPSPDDVQLGDHPANRRQPGELWASFSIPQQLGRFKSLNNITTLTLDRVTVTLSNFPALQHTFWDLIPTISNLRLFCPNACPSSLIRFIAIFRNLQVATIHAPSWIKPDKDTSATHFSQFHGALCLSNLDDGSIPFLSLLGSHATGSKEVTVSKCNFRDFRTLQKFLSSAGKSIRNLQIIVHEDGEVPELSLQDCSALERVFLSVIGATASFRRICSLISSVASPHFRSLVLKLRAATQRDPDIVQTDLADGISGLDGPLSRLARAALTRNRGVSLVLLGQDPEFLAQGLVDFHEVGHIWAGEEVGENEYFWTFTSPKDSRTKRLWIPNRFRRKN